MKLLHRPDLYGWSVFNEDRNIDFHSVVWVRPGGNVVVDPLPMDEHDARHLASLGGAALVIVTNQDHVRDAAALCRRTGAELAGPRAEQGSFPLACSRWLGDGDEPVAGLRVYAMEGSKTPGELALVLEGSTLIAGDLVRAHAAGALCLLPAAKLSSESAARASIRRLLDAEPRIDAVLTGDGWPMFAAARRALMELAR
jgi:glyoxylase-like metal-dependent hydrolase (beta-lactamase superfamily II)